MWGSPVGKGGLPSPYLNSIFNIRILPPNLLKRNNEIDFFFD
jgi:hypothetical protein